MNDTWEQNIINKLCAEGTQETKQARFLKKKDKS